MKTIAFSRKIFTTCAAGILFAASAQADLPATITTTDGATYNGVSLIRVEPDGYLVSYAPVKNGLGVAKIKFSRLSADQKKQASYDPQKAREFEAAVAKGNEDWLQENAKWEQTAKAERELRDRREDYQDQLAIQRLTALAQLEQAEANLEQAKAGDQNYGAASFGDGYGAVAIPTVQEDDNGRFHHHFNNRDGFGHGERPFEFHHGQSEHHQLLSPWPPRSGFNRGPAK